MDFLKRVEPTLRIAHPVDAYLAGLASASIIFFVSNLGLMVFMDSVRFSATRFGEAVLMSFLLAVAYFFFALALAAVPAFATYKIYRRCNMRSLWYFAGCGVIAGCIASVLCYFLFLPFSTGQSEACFPDCKGRPLIATMLMIATIMFPPALVGTVVFGRVLIYPSFLSHRSE